MTQIWRALVRRHDRYKEFFYHPETRLVVVTNLEAHVCGGLCKGGNHEINQMMILICASPLVKDAKAMR